MMVNLVSVHALMFSLEEMKVLLLESFIGACYFNQA